MIEFNGVETLYYGYTDNQGSLVALTDENGTVVERYAYYPIFSEMLIKELIPKGKVN